MMKKIKIFSSIYMIWVIWIGLVSSPITFAYSSLDSHAILFKNVRIFDGRNNQLSGSRNVLIIGNRINKISANPISVTSEVQVIEGNGYTLMPGMIDTHYHITMSGIKFRDFLNSDGEYLGVIASIEAKKILLRGFTTIRDMAGESFGIKKAIDEEHIIGPRIYPSGAALSQTGGHMDLNRLMDAPRHWGGAANPSEKIGAGIIADGIPQVLTGVREQLRRGASQIKVMGGGGIATEYDPIDVIEYSEDEVRTAVAAASNWGTYVAVHVYHPEGIMRALNAGVKSIEHGNLIDESAMKLLAEKGAFLSPQVVVWTNIPPILGEASLAQAKQLAAGLDQMFSLAKKYHVKITFGTDILFNPDTNLESKEITARLRWFTPYEILKQATSNGADLLALSGPRNPYPGKLGVIEENALADLLLVDGDPLTNLSLLENPDVHLKIVMKNGKIYKDIL